MSWAALRWTGVAVFAAILLALLGVLAWSPGADRPHDAPVAIVAPGLVSDMLVSAYGRDEDQVLPVSYDDEAQARSALADGDVVAVVLVDLGRLTDEVLVDGSRDGDLVAGVVARVEAIEHARGRNTHVVDTAAEDRQGKAERVDDAALVACVGGFFIGLTHVVGAWARGRPIASVPRLAVAMTGGSLLVGAVVAVVPALDVGAPWWRTLLAASLAALASSALAVVVSRASRELGVGVASGIQLVSAVPLLRHVDQLMLPEPWRTSFPWTIVGAGRELVASVESGVAVRPVLVLGAWLLAAAVGGAVARHRTRRWHEQLPLVRTAAASLPAAAALLATIGLVATAAPPGRPPRAIASTTECIRVGEPTSVADLNRIARVSQGGEHFGGGDVGADVLLQDGRRLWLFGDTVRDPGPQPRYVRNSMLVFGSECIAVVRPPSGRAVIPDRADGVGYWPMSVARSEQEGYDLVAVGVQRVRTVGDGIWDFEVLGPSVAVFVVPVGGTPQLMQVHDLGRDHADVTEPMWGAAAYVNGGWLYLYGTATTGEPMVFGHSLRVARVRLHEATDQGRWAYWDGDAWSPDADDAVELIPAVGGTSQTLSVWKSGDTWYALSKRDEFLGSHVVVWTAPAPTGPFTAHDPVAELPSDLERGLLRYMPLAHPDLLPRPGTVVVSYSNNRADPDEVTADPLRYRPRFLRVRLPATH